MKLSKITVLYKTKKVIIQKKTSRDSTFFEMFNDTL